MKALVLGSLWLYLDLGHIAGAHGRGRGGGSQQSWEEGGGLSWT